MIIWKKKLIECCKCHKRYSFDDNLFYRLGKYILICPNCNLSHEIDIKLLKERYDRLKKVDKLNLTAIDIGSPAIDRAGVSGGSKTYVEHNNPANESGIINSIEIYVYPTAVLENCKVATFYETDANVLTARDSYSLGTVTDGYHQYNVELNVNSGDYLGVFADNNNLCLLTTGGVGLWNQTGDQTSCTDTTFNHSSSWIMSLYGTGTTEEEGANAIFFGTNF